MSSNSNIQVAIKVRPLLRKEKEQKLTSCWKIHENSIQLADSQSEPFCFDYIFDQDATNQDIFDKMAKHIIHSGIQGFNGTIFAYGQTSSGKTYTMMGDEHNPGVMVLAAKEIFKQIEKESDRQFLLRVGYIEIYNEKIYDLLNKNNRDLKIHETPSGNVSVNCEECIITCEEDLLNYLCMGSKERTVGETNMNERSSRSHAIFRIIIESRKMDRSEDDSVNQSVLNLVDLAGSERAYQTGARGARLKEGGHINKSLHFLSNVIKLLSENGDGEKFINYRDSKLTRILQASLGGNTLTSIICTIKQTAIEETQSTLSFATRAKIIKNKPHVNEIVSEAAMMKRLEREINSLKNQLAEERSKNKSQIKVGQLEQRIKTEVVKIISSNSLHNIKLQKEKRRRTWCTTSSKNEDSQIQSQPLISSLGVAKPAKYFTPQITFRGTLDHYELNVPNIDEEVFEPAENCKFDRISPRRRSSPLPCSSPTQENMTRVSITPIKTADIQCKLKIVENELVELEEFTNLENKLDIKHDTYEALKERLELLKNRYDKLQAERLEYIAIKDDNIAAKKTLEESLKRCNDLENQIVQLTDVQRNATERIADYEKQFQELNDKIQTLETENREAVCLEFEFQRYKNRSQLRESELLEALAEKDSQISKLERSLNSIREEKLQNCKHELMQISRDQSGDKNGQVCLNCNDITLLLEENKKVCQEFTKLTLQYEQLQLNYNKATEDSAQVQTKLNSLEQMHNADVAECEKLTAEVVSMRQKLEQLERDYAALNSDYENKTKAYETLNQDLCKQQTALMSLQDKYDSLDNGCQEQQQTLINVQKEYDAIQLKYHNLQAEYENLEHTSASTLSECTDLRTKNEELQSEIIELKHRVELTQQQLSVGEETKISTDNELEEVKQQNAKLQEDLLDVRQQFEEMQKEYDDLSNQLMDQLQDGELLKQQNIEMASQLEELRREQVIKHGRESEINNGKHLDAENGDLKNELNHVIRIESATQTDSEPRKSVVSESTCSSDLGFDDGDSPETPNKAFNLIPTFDQLAEALDEIELEYSGGKKRHRFYSALQRSSQAEGKQSYRLIFSDIEEIVSVDCNCEETNGCNKLTKNDSIDISDGCIYMQGRFARHKFMILKSRMKPVSQTEMLESTQEDGARDSTTLFSYSDVRLLREENSQLQSLMNSMAQEINEMREKMTKLSAELLEKSMFVEKCACEQYQKQIESLEKERSDMILSKTFAESSRYSCDNKRAESTATMEESRVSEMSMSMCLSQIFEEDNESKLNETLKDDNDASADPCNEVAELHQKVKDLNEYIQELQTTLTTLTASLEEERNNIKSKDEEIKELRKISEGMEDQLATVKKAHEEKQQAFESSKRVQEEEIDRIKKEHKAEIGRLQLELCEKLEKIETDGRENFRKHREWEENKNNYEKNIYELKENIEKLKNANNDLLDAKQELEFKIKSLELENCKLVTNSESTQQDADVLQQKLAKCNEEKQQFEFENLQIKREKENALKELEDLESIKKKQEQTIKELQEQVSFFESLSSEHQQLQKIHENLQQNDLEQQRRITELQDQLKDIDKLTEEKVELLEKNNELRREHDKLLEELRREKEALEEALKTNRMQLKEAEQKIEILYKKIDSLMQELHELKRNVENYEKVLLEYYDLNQAYETAKNEKEQIAKELEQLQQEFKGTKDEYHAIEHRNKELEQKLKDLQHGAEVEQTEMDRLRTQLKKLHEQLDNDQSQLRHEKRELESTFEELKLKYQSLEEHNNVLKKANESAEKALKEAEQKVAACSTLQQQIESLQREKQELAIQLTITIEEAGKCSKELRDDVESHKKMLNQQTEACNKFRSLLETKESSFREERKRLEGTIECLLAKEKNLGERLLATETALKKFEEASAKLKAADNSSSILEKEKYSPHSFRGLERLTGENQLKTINLNLEDRLQSGQHKASHIDSTERKNRRISTHDERRRQSLWSSMSDAATLTDPTDSACNCNDLDLKLKECERNLFIRESQITVLKMELKNNPLKQENIILKKRLQEEQERNSQEIKKYKEIIIEQKTKATNALLAANKAESAVANAAVASARVEKPTLKHIVHVATQTEADLDTDLEFKLHKLESKYNDLKNICRYRYSVIRQLEEKVATLSGGKEAEISNGNEVTADEAVTRANMAGQIQLHEQQNLELQKEINFYKRKYEECHQELESHRAVIRRFRAK